MMRCSTEYTLPFTDIPRKKSKRVGRDAPTMHSAHYSSPSYFSTVGTPFYQIPGTCCRRYCFACQRARMHVVLIPYMFPSDVDRVFLPVISLCCSLFSTFFRGKACYLHFFVTVLPSPLQRYENAGKRFMYIRVGVGWQRRCKTCQSLRELDNQGTVFVLFFGGHHDGYRVRSYCVGWKTLSPHKGNNRIT